MSVYKIIDVVGVSDNHFSDAAKNAIDEAAKTVRGIKRAEVVKLDVKVEDDKVSKYRAEVRISFEIGK
ncbi:MAG: dodecin domain-containing protein [Methanomassiliicoccales archaeon]|nr:MAG: dodecin domain-containing protein [Methanomassiliicoccales archaeon]